jgi:RNA polymerase sigma-70 factor (ECF subfamily)
MATYRARNNRGCTRIQSWRPPRNPPDGLSATHCRIWDRIYCTALYMTGDPTDAEILVQDVFASAYVKFHEVRPGTNCRAWLYRILTATFVEAHRKPSGDPDRGSSIQGRLQQVDAPRQPAGVTTGAHAHLRVDQVRSALQSIPYDMRIVVHLADVENFSRQDIGHILGIPTAVVESRLRSGHRQLCIRLLG